MLNTPSKVAAHEVPLSVPESSYKLPDLDKKPSLGKRLIMGGAILALGLTATTIGVMSVVYRLTHLGVEGGLVNGRQIQLQTPINGEIKDFFARPGVAVRVGEVLARLSPVSQQQQTILQLQGDVTSKSTQLAAERQSLGLLQSQLYKLDGQYQTVQTVDVKTTSEGVSKNQAAVDAAIASETAARLKYQRHRQLLAEGGVSRQLVDQLRAEWQTAQAGVAQAKADLNSTKISLNALVDDVPLNKGGSFQEQRLSLARTIESQTSIVNTLAAQLETSRKKLQEIQSHLSDRRDIEVKAPVAGVIYTTERDAGEQVSRPETLLTMLDCNDLWVETLLSAEQANRINTQKPVRVQLVGEPETLIGEVELIQAISRAELAKDQMRTLLPSVPTNLAGKPLARVMVRIPPAVQQDDAKRLCGVGQSARMTFGLHLFDQG